MAFAHWSFFFEANVPSWAATATRNLLPLLQLLGHVGNVAMERGVVSSAWRFGKKWSVLLGEIPLPKHSMYGIFTSIWFIFHGKLVGEDTIH